MPWTDKQQWTAQAVKHGWKPKGSAVGFGKSLADIVLQESGHMPTRPASAVKKKRGKD